MKYTTKGNANPQGKPKVYFTGHPKDCGLYFERIKDMILKQHDCAIFYDEDPEHPEDMENFISDLDRMQLIVLVVTSRYVYGDTFAHNTVFQHAMEHHIPVLPILEENGIERDFDKKCGDLQYLDPNAKDNTAISFEEKLKKFLDSVLVGDELAAKVRAAFDAYVFLSYRKKDRRYAQQLMRLIHRNPFCRDIAIWYDEFLVPGENFNDAIAKAMEKSELFVMAVTPSLLENPNYVMSTEYPAAKNAGKKILPAVLVPTKEHKLKEYYNGIPNPVDSGNVRALAEALSKAFENIAVLENDGNPQHMFFIGLAYLSGIDVEVDYNRAVRMITDAAEAGLAEAMDKLVSMYHTGEGVERNYETAIAWQRKLVELRKKEFEQSQSEENGLDWLNSLLRLGDNIEDIGHYTEARDVYVQLLEISKKLKDIFKKNWAIMSILISCRKIGYLLSSQLGDLEAAKVYFERCTEMCEGLAIQLHTVESMRELALWYDNLGYIHKAQGDLKAAMDFHKKGLETRKFLAKHADSVQSQSELSAGYNMLGETCVALGDLEGAKTYIEKSLAIDERLAEQNDSVDLLLALSLSYNNLGVVYGKLGDSTRKKLYYEKSLAIIERVAEQEETVTVQKSLCVSYRNLGIECKSRGDLEGARAFYEKELAIAIRLAEQTDTVESKTHLADVYEKLGDIYKKQGDLTGAKTFFEKGLLIHERLEKLMGSSKSQKALAVIYEQLGQIYVELGDLMSAKTYYEKSLAIHECLGKQTDSEKTRRTIAVICHNLTVVYHRLGDMENAEKYCEKSLSFGNRGTERTDSVNVQTDMALSYEKQGKTCIAKGDLEGAKAYYEKSLAIRERLAAKTDSVKEQKSLSVVCYNLGVVCEGLGDLQGARSYFMKFLSIREGSASDSADAQDELAASYEKLGGICKKQKDVPAAMGYYDELVRIRKELVESLKTAKAYDDLAKAWLFRAGAEQAFENMIPYMKQAEGIWVMLAKQYPNNADYADMLAKMREILP